VHGVLGLDSRPRSRPLASLRKPQFSAIAALFDRATDVANLLQALQQKLFF